MPSIFDLRSRPKEADAESSLDCTELVEVESLETLKRDITVLRQGVPRPESPTLGSGRASIVVGDEWVKVHRQAGWYACAFRLRVVCRTGWYRHYRAVMKRLSLGHFGVDSITDAGSDELSREDWFLNWMLSNKINRQPSRLTRGITIGANIYQIT